MHYVNIGIPVKLCETFTRYEKKKKKVKMISDNIQHSMRPMNITTEKWGKKIKLNIVDIAFNLNFTRT